MPALGGETRARGRLRAGRSRRSSGLRGARRADRIPRAVVARPLRRARPDARGRAGGDYALLHRTGGATSFFIGRGVDPIFFRSGRQMTTTTTTRRPAVAVVLRRAAQGPGTERRLRARRARRGLSSVVVLPGRAGPALRTALRRRPGLRRARRARVRADGRVRGGAGAAMSAAGTSRDAPSSTTGRSLAASVAPLSCRRGPPRRSTSGSSTGSPTAWPTSAPRSRPRGAAARPPTPAPAEARAALSSYRLSSLAEESRELAARSSRSAAFPGPACSRGSSAPFRPTSASCACSRNSTRTARRPGSAVRRPQPRGRRADDRRADEGPGLQRRRAADRVPARGRPTAASRSSSRSRAATTPERKPRPRRSQESFAKSPRAPVRKIPALSGPANSARPAAPGGDAVRRRRGDARERLGSGPTARVARGRRSLREATSRSFWPTARARNAPRGARGAPRRPCRSVEAAEAEASRSRAEGPPRRRLGGDRGVLRPPHRDRAGDAGAGRGRDPLDPEGGGRRRAPDLLHDGGRPKLPADPDADRVLGAVRLHRGSSSSCGPSRSRPAWIAVRDVAISRDNERPGLGPGAARPRHLLLGGRRTVRASRGRRRARRPSRSGGTADGPDEQARLAPAGDPPRRSGRGALLAVVRWRPGADAAAPPPGRGRGRDPHPPDPRRRRRAGEQAPAARPPRLRQGGQSRRRAGHPGSDFVRRRSEAETDTDRDLFDLPRADRPPAPTATPAPPAPGDVRFVGPLAAAAAHADTAAARRSRSSSSARSGRRSIRSRSCSRATRS